ncbi:MAG: DNA ligase [Lachnospiraceae bacterium]|nr:DNA ligase [Lachnospiraceae bacterium]
MSKEFTEALEALRVAGNTLLSLSDTIEKVLREAAGNDQAGAAEEKTAGDDSAAQTAAPEAEPTEPAPDLSEVKAYLMKKSRAGYTKEVKELLKKYGADRLSALDPSHFRDLMKEAEVIGNAG